MGCYGQKSKFADVVSVVDVDHAHTTMFATETYPLSPGPVSVPVPKQLELGSASGGLETPTTVSDHWLYSRLLLLITGHLAYVFGHP